MIVMKRNGQEAQYHKAKIHDAIDKAVTEVKHNNNDGHLANVIANRLDSRYRSRNKVLSVEDIQDDVETELMKEKEYEVAKAYIRYRHEHELMRNGNVIDGQILTIVDGVNETVIQENSNKNPTILSTQRDYIAGEISKDISRRVLLPEDINKAHEEGLIHVHDLDYFVQRMHNCCLVNLEDMLQNGTVISGTMIEKPHSFSTACNIATQIIAQVASCQYGGQSISLAHLAPFVDVSRQKIRKQVEAEFKEMHNMIHGGALYELSEAAKEAVDKVTEERVYEEVKRGVQTIQYQVVTLMTTNGQAPFITVFMYLNEVEEGQTKDDLAMIIEEVVRQRYEGVKNEKGVWITPAFPKLIYVLEPDNITEDSKYWYLTKLCAKCTAKRLVPDYISEKIMLENKIDSLGEGHCYTCMGCLDYEEHIELDIGIFEIGRIADSLELLLDNLDVLDQFEKSGNKCKLHDVKLIKNGDRIDLKVGRKIVFKDVKKLLSELKVHRTERSVSYELPENYMKIKCNDEFVGLKNILFNENVDNWLKISYRYDERRDHIRSITLTCDHLLPCIDGVVRRADELKVGDKLIRINVKAAGPGKQWDFAEIISIESVDQIRRSYDVTTETEYFDINQDILSHNCRSFLTPYVDPETNQPKYYGRFNQGVVTINLPDVGLSARQMMIDKHITYVDDEQWNRIQEEFFWEIFEERLELCHKALRLRHERLLGTLSDASPIHWQNGALARLKKGETIDKLLYGGYSTLSLGYAGLYECVKAMTGKSHTDEDVKPFALAIMQKMNDKCAEWRAAENIAYSLYGTPIESTTYKFAKCLRKRFGIIEGVTDKDYITNSYHIHVTEHINAFDKLKFEAEFQLLSPGGAISYIETANLTDNIEAILTVMKYIYENIMYAELNTKSDYCQECGYDGEIEIIENEDGKLIWRCPNCGNTNKSKMNIARRTCGYIGTNDWNQGRTQEIKERYVHLGGD